MQKFITLFIFIFSTTSMAQDFSHFQKILDKHLNKEELAGGGIQTSFDYESAYRDLETKDLIKKQSEQLKSFSTKSLLKKNQAIAFWINSYNFFMIKAIFDEGFKKGKLNINSVKDLGSFFNPYRIFTKEIHNIGGHKMSLDQIEKGTLLGDAYKKKGWKDARIHFAVNCASVGCPPIIKTIYTADNVDKILDTNVEQSFKNKRHFHIKNGALYLTHLFKWYKKDFEEHSGSVKSFLKKYINDSSLQGKIHEASIIKYIEYDWKLNRAENFKQPK